MVERLKYMRGCVRGCVRGSTFGKVEFGRAEFDLRQGFVFFSRGSMVEKLKCMRGCVRGSTFG